MKAESFIDTNVFVYAANAQGKDAWKQAPAHRLLREADYGISAQILQEFYNVVTRKGAPPMPHEEAVDWLALLAAAPVVVIDTGLVRDAAEFSHRYKISYYDGALIAAAHRLGATTLYTEDLNGGQLYGSVRVENPFKIS